jgi:hypothetical protein
MLCERRSIHHLPVEVLLDLARLVYVLGPPTRTEMGRASQNRVDCPEFRQLARQELDRRGIHAER